MIEAHMAEDSSLKQKIDDVMGKKGQTDRQLDTLIGISEKLLYCHTSGKSSVVPICLAPLRAKHFK